MNNYWPLSTTTQINDKNACTKMPILAFCILFRVIVSMQLNIYGYFDYGEAFSLYL